MFSDYSNLFPVTLLGVEGSAGTGKTCRLMDLLSQALSKTPLGEGQRVLGLTFMHGSRHRLRDRLLRVPGLSSRFDCMTIDGFAQRILVRWKSLAKALSVAPGAGSDFEAQCEGAGRLLERSEVRSWIAATHPVVVVDEAQDLNLPRLRMLRALSPSVTMLVAADEFQCLDSLLRPAPAVEWLRNACTIEVLTTVHRTSETELLTAAADIRAGRSPRSGKIFRVLGSKGPEMAAWHLANALAWGATSDVAILAPSKKGGYASKIVSIVCKKPCGKNKSGPYSVRWERSSEEEASEALASLQIADQNSLEEVVAAIQSLGDGGPFRDMLKWIRRRNAAFGVGIFSREDIKNAIVRMFILRRQRARDWTGFVAMSVHQAKNREFDGVVVVWPHTVGGDDETKRRLLYNAVTRAKLWCTVILQRDDMVNAVPFG